MDRYYCTKILHIIILLEMVVVRLDLMSISLSLVLSGRTSEMSLINTLLLAVPHMYCDTILVSTVVPLFVTILAFLPSVSP